MNPHRILLKCQNFLKFFELKISVIALKRKNALRSLDIKKDKFKLQSFSARYLMLETRKLLINFIFVSVQHWRLKKMKFFVFIF
jgi:hypothetical protein